MRMLDRRGFCLSSDEVSSKSARLRRQRHGRAKRLTALLLCWGVVGALCCVVLQESAAEAAPSQPAFTPGAHGDTGSQPTITNVVFKGSKRNPIVSVTGTGFGTVPPPPRHANCGASGKNFPRHVLYLRDLTQRWDAGITGNCIGLKIETYTNTMIKFRFGNYYDTPPYFYALAPGDQFEFAVMGTVASGTVAYGVSSDT